LGPCVCIRAVAEDEERPWVTDVESFCAVSWDERRVYCEVNVYKMCHVSPSLPHHGRAERPTAGLVRRCARSGGCRNGDGGRDDLPGFAVALKSGSDGVEALDILAWPEATVAL
jgi:hypothetical protein